MARYTAHINGNFKQFLSHIEAGIAQGSISASREGGADFERDGVRCAMRVYERYSYIGSNRLSLAVTVFGGNDSFDVAAVTSGGSQAVFFKINTFGEEAFMNKFIELVQAFR